MNQYCVCGSDRFLFIGAKCSDMCYAEYRPQLHSNEMYVKDGYVPGLDGLGGGDYIKMQVCCVCSRIQGGGWPHDELVEALKPPYPG